MIKNQVKNIGEKRLFVGTLGAGTIVKRKTGKTQKSGAPRVRTKSLFSPMFFRSLGSPLLSCEVPCEFLTKREGINAERRSTRTFKLHPRRHER